MEPLKRTVTRKFPTSTIDSEQLLLVGLFDSFLLLLLNSFAPLVARMSMECGL